MLRWRTLNNGDETEQLDNTEIQTEHLLELYQTALNIHQKGSRADAKAKYELILSNDVMTAEDTEEHTKGNALHSSSLVMLRFLVFKNYATIVEEESADSNLSTVERNSLLQMAMDYYIKALMVDPTDRSIWYHIGAIAVSLQKLCLARSAYEQGFYLNTSKLLQQPTATSLNLGSTSATKNNEERITSIIFKSGNISPIQWRCLEGLCTVLYNIGDHDLCSTYLKLGLQRFPGWSFAKNLESEMTTINNLHASLPHIHNKTTDSHHNQPIIMTIATPSWTGVLSVLLDQYKQTHLNKKVATRDQHFIGDGDKGGGDLKYANRVIRIDIESVDDTLTEVDEDTVMLDTHVGQQHQADPNTLDTTSSTNHDHPPTITVDTTSTETTEPKYQGEDHKETQKLDSIQQTTIPHSTALIKLDKNDGSPSTFANLDQPGDSTDGVAIQQQSNQSTSEPDERIVINLTLDDQDDTSGLLKRKRDDEDGKNLDSQNNDDKEDDDEQEHEAKRTSLRASKRQKEKVESEEVFKKKMLEEEEALTKKAQAVFDTFGDSDDFRRGTPWFTPVNSGIDSNTLESFWEYFDYKVSELGANFTWNFEALKTKDTFSVLPRKKYQFAKFEASVSPPTVSTPNRERTATVRQFIHSLNETNSGTTDSLCQAIMAVLRLNAQSYDEVTSNELGDLLLDATDVLEQELLNTILYNNIQDLGTQAEDYEQQIQIMACLSEKLVDRLIDTIRTEQATMNGSTLSSKQRSLADKQNKLIEHYRKRCNMWIGLMGQVLEQAAVNAFGPSSLTNNGVMDQLLNKQRLFLRFWLLKGKMAQCENDVDTAVGWYKKCERLFANMDNNELDFDLQCRYDSVVNLSTIQDKLALMERDKYIAASQVKLAENDYLSALAQLESLASGQSKGDQDANTSDDFSITIMLAKCYMKTERYADAWKCYVDILSTLVPQLVAYGGDCIKNNSMLPKGEDVELFRLLCSLDTTIDALVHLLLDTKYEDWLPTSLTSRFIDSLMIMLRTTVLYTFRHPDFIPLVNNFSNPDVRPHVPSKKTKINSYNAVTTKLWVMVSTLAQRNIQKEKGDDKKMASLADLLQQIHDELGEREVCGASKGIFLQHLIKALTSTDIELSRRGIYQCYHCLYGVHLAGEAELIEEHHANHGNITKEAAEHLYKLVVNDVLQKMDRKAPLKSDLKDAIETVSGIFGDLPDDNPHVQRNRDIIASYLERPVYINHPIKSLLQQCDLPIDGTHGHIPSLSVVFEHIFLIRGKLLRIHIKNRPRVSSDRTMLDLEEAVEHFKCHVILHPDDHQGWYELGSTLMQLADEELTWSAVNITTHKGLIADYQKEAFHAFMKAWRLTNSGHSLKKSQLFGFFTSFGSLVYGMACAPMDMASFEWSKPIRTLDKSGGLINIQPKKPDPNLAYRLALTLFSQALQFKSHDRSEWSTLRSIGKCVNNLGRPPREVLDWYVKSIRQYRDTGSSGSIPMEALYKFYAALLKFLYHGTLQPRDVSDYLKRVSTIHQTDLHAGSTSLPSLSGTVTTPPPHSTTNESNSMTGIINLPIATNYPLVQPIQEPLGRMEAFGLLFDKLAELRKSDKKHLYHRPVYKIAWMYHKIYNDAQNAKLELLPLFTLKQPNKGLVNIWRSEYERPGKHFVFNKQYVSFLIDLAKETSDLDTLKNMCRKLKRASTTLLKEDEGFQEALSTYIEVLQGKTLKPLQGSTKRQQIITGSVNKEEFDTLCKDLTKDMASSTGTMHYIIPILQDLMDIRRQAIGYVSTDDLDITIQDCFAVLLFEQTKIQTLLPQEPKTSFAATTSSLQHSAQDMDENSFKDTDMESTFVQPDKHLDTAPVQITSKHQDTTDGNQDGIDGKTLLHRAVALTASLNSTGRTQ